MTVIWQIRWFYQRHNDDFLCGPISIKILLKIVNERNDLSVYFLSSTYIYNINDYRKDNLPATQANVKNFNLNGFGPFVSVSKFSDAEIC